MIQNLIVIPWDWSLLGLVNDSDVIASTVLANAKGDDENDIELENIWGLNSL